MTDLPLAGLRVGVTAARKAAEQTTLLERRGAEVVWAPALSVDPYRVDVEALSAMTAEVVSKPVDLLLGTTGIGMRTWFRTLEAEGTLDSLVAVLAEAELVARGPKTVGALRQRGLREDWVAPHEELAETCVAAGSSLGLEVEVRQTDAEHEMLGWLHEAADASTPVVLNPGGWTHTSVALRDACAALTAPLVEVHISNVHKREAFRHHSFVSSRADGVLAGFGTQGYLLALRRVAMLAEAAG